MPPFCKICNHPARQEIEAKIFDRVPYTDIEAEFGMSDAAVSRHVLNHMTKLVSQFRPAGTRDVVNAAYILGRVRELEKAALWVTAQAQKKEKYSLMLQGVRETRECLRFYLDVLALQRQEGVGQTQISSIVDSDDWRRLEGIVLDVLEDQPETRQKLTTKLLEAVEETDR